MTDQKYNGWTNYATWRVNLEMFDGQPVHDIDGNTSAYDLAQTLKELADEYISETASGFALGYARAFLNEVNWVEIAQHMIADYADA